MDNDKEERKDQQKNQTLSGGCGPDTLKKRDLDTCPSIADTLDPTKK